MKNFSLGGQHQEAESSSRGVPQKGTGHVCVCVALTLLSSEEVTWIQVLKAQRTLHCACIAAPELSIFNQAPTLLCHLNSFTRSCDSDLRLLTLQLFPQGVRSNSALEEHRRVETVNSLWGSTQGDCHSHGLGQWCSSEWGTASSVALFSCEVKDDWCRNKGGPQQDAGNKSWIKVASLWLWPCCWNGREHSSSTLFPTCFICMHIWMYTHRQTHPTHPIAMGKEILFDTWKGLLTASTK